MAAKYTTAAALLAAAVSTAMGTAAYAQCTGFSVAATTGASIVPGTTDSGNHGDDVTTTIPLPFNVLLYGVAYGSATLSSNGNIQLTTANAAYTNTCLPTAGMGITLFPHWDDLRTDAGGGIFTSISGAAPNRVFNIEWRATYFNGGGSLNFEARLFEDASKVEFIYGAVAEGGQNATVGIQHTTFPSTQYECNTGGIVPNSKITFTCSNGPLPPQGTGTATPSTVLSCNNPTNSLLVVQASPGFNPPSTNLAVTGDLTSVGGSSTQVFYDDATHGDVTAGDNRFSFQAALPGNMATGSRTIPFTLSDAQGRANTGIIGLQVNGCPTTGPDVYVGTVTDMSNYGTVDVDPTSGVRNVTAYSVGTDACNLGDLPVYWIDNNSHPGHNANEHPVIAQNMYRLKDGRFEQLGQSWLKHGFVSTNSNGCATCVQPPFGGDQLGVNCSDTYGSGLNGSQGGLGPRWEVNATSGVYPFPFSSPATDATIGRRLQVYTDDITPSMNVGAQYFVDAHYVTQDDAQFTQGAVPATNGLNNTSYRSVLPSSLVGGTPSFNGNTIRFKSGIQAWKDTDPTVQLANLDYADRNLISAGVTGRFIMGCKVTNNGNGTWHYEYAVYNVNADRSGGSFSVPVDAGAVVTNVGFHGVFGHSGDPYPNTALNPDNWPGSKVGGEVKWMAPETYNAAVNGNNGNALRWGTLYNFRFDANVPPRSAPATLGLWRPATALNPSVSVTGAASAPVSACGSADFNGDGDTGTDADIEAFFRCLAGTCCATCWYNGADFNGDGDVGTDADIEAFFRVLAGNPC